MTASGGNRVARGALAALVAALLSSTLWGSTAAANDSVFCEANAPRCSAAQTYGGELVAEGESATFQFVGAGSTSCTSTLKSELEARTVSFSFAGCSGGCTLTAAAASYDTSFAAGAEGDGSLVVSDGGEGSPAFVAICGGTECVYATTELEFSVDGGEVVLLSVEAGLTRLSGSLLCPTNATLSATYLVGTPLPGFVVTAPAPPPVEGTRICLVAAEECPSESARGLDLFAPVAPETLATFKLAALDLTCPGGSVSIVSNTSEGPGLEGELTLEDNCTFPLIVANPRSVELNATGGGDGELIVAAPAFAVNAFGCVWSAESVTLDFLGGEPATVVASSEVLPRTKGTMSGCGNSAIWSGVYEVTEPAPALYAAFE